MKALMVKWYDAAVTEDRWSDLEEAINHCRQDKLVACVTIGFLLDETDPGLPTHTIHLTSTNGTDQVGPITHIPVCSIISRSELNELPVG